MSARDQFPPPGRRYRLVRSECVAVDGVLKLRHVFRWEDQYPGGTTPAAGDPPGDEPDTPFVVEGR